MNESSMRWDLEQGWKWKEHSWNLLNKIKVLFIIDIKYSYNFNMN